MDQALEPTRAEERIAMLDSTRGIAVLGILLMNITGFGLPNAYDNPTNWGGADGASLIVWRTMTLLFEGTMRGLFTVLFGAGALLFLERHARRNAGLLPADLYFRRTLWLAVFGLVNGYALLWDGDILFYYGVTGLLLFVFRNLSVRKLLVTAAIIMVLQTGVTIGEWAGFTQMQSEAQAAQRARATGARLTEAEREAIESFREMVADFRPPRDQQEALVESIQGSYTSAFEAIAPRTWYVHTNFFFRHGLLESLGMMLFGMALFRAGVLTGAASTRMYATLALLGYGIGLSVNTYEVMLLERAGFSAAAIIESYLTYDLGRIPTMLGHIGLIGLIVTSGMLKRVMKVLASVGQMALTNYLAQSLICMMVFTGAGFGLFGKLQRYELYYVVLGIWVVQLIWSPLWLRRFRFGPMEWVWRSLTYWQRQPLRRDRIEAQPVTSLP